MLKHEAEDKVRDHTAHGLRATIIRPFRTFGPGCTTGLVAEACLAAVTGAELSLTDGQQVREWNHIDAIATGIIAAAQESPSGNTWNLGGGDRLSVAGLAQRIFALAGRRPEAIKIGAHARRTGEVDRFWGDHRRADSRWGPLEPVDLDTGLHQTLTWHQARSAQ